MSYVHMAGTVGTTPELRHTKNGRPWCRLRLAVTRWDSASGQEATDWWTLKAFGNIAERAEKILRPGSNIVFRGYPVQERWVDKEGGKHHDVSITMESFTVARHAPQPEETLQAQPAM